MAYTFAELILSLQSVLHLITLLVPQCDNSVLNVRHHHGAHDDLPRAGGSQRSSQSALPYSAGLLCLHIIHIHFLNCCPGKCNEMFVILAYFKAVFIFRF